MKKEKLFVAGLAVIIFIGASCKSSNNYQASTPDIQYSTAEDETAIAPDGFDGQIDGKDAGDTAYPPAGMNQTYQTSPDKDVVNNIAATGYTSTFSSALEASGLSATLHGTGPYTIFAPDNDAFLAVSSSTISSWMQAKNRTTLRAILQAHIVRGRFTMDDLKDGQVLTTMDGNKLTVHKITTTIKIGSGFVETRDIASTNGVVHLIDRLLRTK